MWHRSMLPKMRKGEDELMNLIQKFWTPKKDLRGEAMKAPEQIMKTNQKVSCVMQKTIFDKWDAGKHTYSVAEEKLIALKGGEEISSATEDLTICPVGNASCIDMINMEIVGFHPTKKSEHRIIQVCGLGVKNGNKCPLNK